MYRSQLHLNLGKCWQGKEPWLCFQATISVVTPARSSDGGDSLASTQRHRGFVLLDARRGRSALSWQNDKPDGIVNAGGCASLVRKYIPSGRVVSLALGTSENPAAFAGLVVSVPQAGESDLFERFFVGVTSETPPVLELVGTSTGSGMFNYLRWNEKGLFTVKKPPSDVAKNLLTTASENESMLPSVLASWLGLDTPDQHSKDSQPATEEAHGLPIHQRQARDRVSRRLKTLVKTLKQDQTKVPTKDTLQTARQEAELLKTWLHLVKPDMIELLLGENEVGYGKSEAIPLDPDKSPGAQLSAKFHELRRLEKAFELGGRRLDSLGRQIEATKAIYQKLQGPEALTESQTLGLLHEAGLAPKTNSSNLGANKRESTAAASLGRVFKSSDGAFMQLGRSALENDQITKAAKSNDWWVHTSGGVHGTHVVIPKKSVKASELPAATLREAAILAIHFSSLSLSRSGEVYVTTRGQLKKRKGMPPGLWHIERTKTIMVRYEEAELTRLFQNEIRSSGTLRHAPQESQS